MSRIRTSALLALACVAATVVVTSCRDELGPESPRLLSLALAPSFDSQFAGLVQVTKVRLRAVRQDFGVTVADTIVDVAGRDSVEIGFRVPVVDKSEVFLITLALVGTAQDTVFRGGPIQVPATGPTATGQTPITVNLTYVGVGANADSVVISTAPPSLFTGGTTILQAVAYRNNLPVPGTPIAWRALDSAVATVPDYTVGQVVGGAQRGNARIVAELLTGRRDTTTVSVQPAPASGNAPTGNAQSGEVGLALPNPVMVQVLAGDGLGVRNAVVRFSGDGTFSPDTGVTDASGNVTTQWTLGTVAGVQTAVATVDDDPAGYRVGPDRAADTVTSAETAATHVMVGLTATATPGPATQLAFTAQPTNQVAGTPIPVGVTLLDSLNNVVDADSTTPVTLSVVPGTGTSGATIIGTNPETAVAGLVAFGVAIDSVGTAYQFEATAPGLAPDTSLAFDVGVGALSTIGLTPAADTITALGDSTLFTPTATDSLGNTVAGTSLTWSSSDSSVAIPNASGYALAVGNGNATITATSGTVAGTATVFVQQVITTVTVTPGTATHTAIPDTTQFTAAAFDANANPVAAAPFTWSLSDSSVATVDATGEVISLANGTTDVIATSGGVADSATLTVGQMAASLVFAPQPTTTAAGDTIPVTVEIRDAANAVVTGYTDTVTITIAANPSGAALGGTVDVAAVNGVAIFTDLSITVADISYSLEAASGTLPPDTSALFDIIPNTTAALQFAVQPTDAFQLDTIAPAVVVTATDAFGNVATAFVDSIDVQFATNPSAAILLGTTREVAVAGVATFADLSVDNAGNGYTLEATATGLTPDTSATFNILPSLGGGVHWTNAAGGNWSDAGSWSTGLVPGALDTVFIDAIGTYTVALNQNATVAQLFVGGVSGTQTLSITGNTLQVDSLGMIQAGDSVHQTGGTFRGAGEMNVFGAWTWGGGVWNDSARTIIHIGANLWMIGGTTKTAVGRIIQLDGTTTVSGAGTFQFQTTAFLDIQSTGLFDLQTNAPISPFNLGTYQIGNRGTVQRSAGAGLTTISIPFTNDPGATLAIQTGDLEFNTTASLDGTVTVATGSTLDVQGGTTVLVDGFTLAGTPSGHLTHTGGTLQIGNTNTDVITVGLLDRNGGMLSGNGQLMITDTLLWAVGQQTGNGQGITRIPSGALLRTTGGSTLASVSRDLEIAGIVEWASTGDLQFQGSSLLDIQTGGVFDVQTAANLSAFNVGTYAIQNTGTFLKTGSGLTTIGVPFTNGPAATLDIQTGDFEFNTTATLNGTVTVANGSTLDVQGGTTVLPNGFTLAGTPSGHLTHTGGTIQIGTASTDIITVGLLDRNGGALSGNGQLVITDTLLWTVGQQTGNGQGITRIPSGALLRTTGGSTLATVSRNLEIAGMVEWASTGELQFQGSSLLDIQTGGVFDVRSSANLNPFNLGTYAIQNAGTFLKTGSGLTTIGVPFTNGPAATLDIQTGDFEFNTTDTLNGTVIVANGSTLDVQGGTTILPDGFTLPGTPSGHLTHTGGTIQIGTAGTDIITVGLLDRNGGTLSGNGQLVITDTLLWTVGQQTGNGQGITRIPSGALLRTTGGTTLATVSRDLEIAGTVEWTSTGELQFQGSSLLDIQAGGVFDVQSSANLSPFNLGTYAIQNTGTFLKTGSGLTTIGVPFTNGPTATLDIQSGDFEFNTTDTLNGTVTVANGSTLDVQGGTTILPDGFTLAGTPSGHLTHTGGTIQIGTASTDIITVGLLDRNGGTLSGNGQLVITDSLLWTVGQQTGNGQGITRIPSGALLRTTGGTTLATVSRNLEIAGTVEWASAGELQFQGSSQLDVQTGGLFDLRSDAGLNPFNLGTYAIQNSGRFQKSAGAGVSTIGVPFTNDDTLDVQSGTVQVGSAVAFAHNTGAVLMGNGVLNIAAAAVSAFNGNVEPGASPGILALTGVYSPGASSTFEAEIDGNIPGVGSGGHDQFNVSGAVTLNGVLNVTFPGSYLPNAGDSYEIITSATGITGSFTTVNFPSLGATFDTATVGNSFFVNVLGANFNRWQNAAGGNWNNTANWSLGVVPNGAADTAIIDLVGNYTVTLDIPVTVDALVLGAGTGTNTQELEIVGNNLTINTSANVVTDGLLQHRSGTLLGLGTVTVDGNGVYRWTGGTMGGAGVTELIGAGQLILDSALTKTLDTRTLNNQTGTVTWINGQIQGTGNPTFTNAGLFDLQNDFDMLGGGSITNTGTMQKSGGTASAQIVWTVNNNGQLTVGAGTGTIELRGGTSAGNFTVDGTLQFAAAISNLTAASTVSGGGSFLVSGSAVVNMQGAFSMDTTQVVAGALNFNQAGPDSAVTNTLLFGGGQVSGIGLLHVTTDGIWSGGTFAGTGATRFGPSATWQIAATNAHALNARLIDNEGSLTWATNAAGLTLQVSNGATIRNAPGALFDAQAVGLIDFTAGAVGLFDNQGTFRHSGGNPFVIDITFDNADSVDILTGALLNITRGGTGSGVITLSGGTLEFGTGGLGGTYTSTDSVAQVGIGAVGFSGGTTQIQGPYSVGYTYFNAGTATFGTAITDTAFTDTLQIAGGTLDGPGRFHVSTTGRWTGGGMGGTGVTYFGPAATVDVQTANAKSLDTRRVDNEGTLAWSGTGTLTAANGAVINNLAGATFNPQDGATINQGAGALAVFNNNGLVVRTGFNQFIVNIPFNNNDSVDVANPGSLELLGGGTSPGFYNVSATGTLNFAGGHTLDTVLAPGGIVGFGAGTNVITGAFNANTTSITGGDIEFSTPDTSRVGRLLQTAGNLRGTAPVVITQPGASGGFWTGGNWVRTASITVAPGAAFDFNSAASQMDTVPVIVQGTVNHLSGAITGLNGAQITTAVGGLYDILGPSAYLPGAGGASFINSGTLRRGIGPGLYTMGADFTNSGTGLIDLVTGTVAWTGAFDHLTGGMLQGFTSADLSGAAIGTFQGNVNPGQGTFIGILGYVGNLNPGANSSIDIEIDGLTPGAGGTFHDQLQVTGAVNLAGTLDVTFPGLFIPGPGDQFEVITSTGGVSGSFATVNLPSPGGVTLDTATIGNSFFLIAPTGTNNWVGGAGNWSVPGNWSLNRVPIATDTVFIDTTGTYTVTLDQNATVNRLVLGGASGTPTLETAGFTLGVSGSAAVNGNGTLAINGGALNSAGALQIDGTVDWSDGDLLGIGSPTTVGPAGVINVLAGGAKQYQHAITLNGTLNVVSSDVTAAPTSALNPSATALIDFQGDFAILNGGAPAGTMTSTGTIQKSAGAGASGIGIPLANNGQLDVQTGTMQLSGGGTSAGSFTVSGTLQFGGGANTLTSVSTVTGNGRFLVSAGSVDVQGSYIIDSTQVGGATLNFNRAGPDSSTTITLIMGGGTMGGAGLVHVITEAQWSQGVIRGGGITRIGPAATLDLTGTGFKTLDNRTIDNEGILLHSGAGAVQLFNSASVTNRPGARIDLQSTSSWTQAGGTVGALTNQGLLEFSAPGVFLLDLAVNNADSIEISGSGFLQFGQGGTSSGTSITSLTAGSLEFAGGTFAVADSIIGLGSVIVSGGNATFSGPFDNIGGFALTGGTANLAYVADTVVVQSFQQLDGTLDGPAILRFNVGSWTGGTQTGAGSIHIPAGAFYSLGPATAVRTLDARTVDNEGTTQWATTGVLLNDNGATFNNLPNGVFDIQQNGTWQQNAGALSSFVNQGVVQSATPSYVVSVAFQNGATGVLDIQSGIMDFNSTFSHASGAILQGDGTIDLATATVTSFDGDVAPGTSPGVLGYNGTFAAGTPSTVAIELDGTTPGSGAGFHDQLNVSGTFNGGGTLDVTTDVNYTPTAGDSLVVMTFTTRAGGTANFATVNLPVLGGGLTADTVWTTNALSVVVRGPGGNINTWVGGTGNWNVPGNWSLNRVPVATDTVLIDAVGTYTVTLNTNASIDALFMGAPSGTQTLHIDSLFGDTLTLANGGTVLPGGVFEIDGGSLDGTGTLTVDGTFNWIGGLLQGAGTLSISSVGSMVITGSGVIKMFDQRTIENAGNTTWIIGQIRGGELGNGGVFRNLPSGVVEVQGIGPFTWFTGTQPTFDNQGLFQRTTSAASLDIGFNVTNTGTIQVLSGQLRFHGGGTYTGPVTLAANTTWLLDGGTFAHNFGNGFVESGPGIVRLGSGGQGVTTIATGTATVDHLELTDGILDGPGTVIVQDTLDWLNGTMTGAGVTRSNGTMLVRGGGTQSLGDRTIQNAGTADWSLGDIRGVGPTGGGSITNLSGATLQVTGGVSMIQTGGALPTFTNQGTLDISGGLGTTWAFNHTAGLLQGNGVLDLSSATVGTMTGNVGPGASAGVLTITGSYPQGAGARFIAEIEGPTPGVGPGSHDQLTVSNAASLNGLAVVSFLGGYTPVVGDRYDLMTFGSTSGGFGGGISLPTPQGNLTFDSRFYPTRFVVGVTQTTSNLGIAPQVMSRNTSTDSLYIFGSSNQMLTVDAKTGTPDAPTTTASAAEWVEVHEALDKIFVTEPGQGSIEVLSGSNRGRIGAITGFTATMGEIAAHQASDSLYMTFVSALQGFPVLAVIDGAQEALAGTLQIGTGGTPEGVAVDPVNNRVYAVLSSGWLVRIDSDTRTIADSVAVGTNPIGVAVDPSTRLVYVVNSGSLDVTVIDDTQPSGNAVIGSISGLSNATPWSIAVDANQQVVVGYQDAPIVTILDGLGRKFLYDLPNGSSSTSFVEWDPNSGAFFFTNTAEQTLRGSR